MQWLVLESQIFLVLHSSKLVTRDVSSVQLSQDICPIQDILLHNSVMCLANFPSQSRFLEIPRGGGVSKAIFKWKYEPKLKLTVGLGDYGGKRGSQTNKSSMGGYRYFFMEQHNGKKCAHGICCSCGLDQWNTPNFYLNNIFSCSQLQLVFYWTQNYILLKSDHKNDHSLNLQ